MHPQERGMREEIHLFDAEFYERYPLRHDFIVPAPPKGEPSLASLLRGLSTQSVDRGSF